MRWSSFPSRSWARSFSRVRCVCSRCCSGVGFGGVWSGRRRWRKQQVEDALFGGLLGSIGDFVELFFAHHVDGSFDKVADHRFDIAADVADFGVFRGFDFDEWAAGQTREAAGDFGFADAGWADHQNIFGKNVFSDFGRKLLATHAIAQGDCDGTFGGVLADDVFVELGDDLAWRHVVERGQKLLLGRRSVSVAARHEYNLFVGLASHETFCSRAGVGLPES